MTSGFRSGTVLPMRNQLKGEQNHDQCGTGKTAMVYESKALGYSKNKDETKGRLLLERIREL
jgi:hypothetical protein